MGLITMFLLVVILALSTGHFFLYITKPLPVPKFLKEPAIEQHPAIINQQIAFLHTSHKALHEKVGMAHSRINELENISKTTVQQPGQELKQKLRKLDHFRANTEIELKALKEIVTKTNKRPSEKKTRLSDAKLRKLAFNSKNSG